jgi:putative ABC transport system permease protein
MFDIDKYKEIWQTIKRNKMRSIITGFGIAWGIFLFIVMFGLGNGFQGALLGAFGESVANTIVFFPSQTTMEYKGFNPGRRWGMYNEDIEIIKQTIPAVKYISGTISNSAGKVVYGDKNMSCMMRSGDVDFFEIEPLQLVYGKLFNQMDIEEKRKICLIGYRVWEEMFGTGENPVGEQLMVNGIAYTIVGVLEKSDMSLIGNTNESVIIPLTTMQQVLNSGSVVDVVMAVISPEADINRIDEKVQTLIKANHNIAPNDNDAIISFNLHDYFLMFDNLFLGIKILVWIVGMGTLLAGVVGVSNIMLISIRERTNEIGIRRALGAKPGVILRQIIGESLMLTFIAGYIGFLFGILALEVVEKLLQMQNTNLVMNMQISFGTSMLAMTILITAGIIAGIIPAKNALKIKVIDAIRDE